MGTASLATARTPQPPACPRGGFAPWGAATSPPVARPFTDTPCSSPLWFPVPPLLCPAPLASARPVGRRCSWASGSAHSQCYDSPPCAFVLVLGFVFSFAPLCLVPSCGPCLLFGVLAPPAEPVASFAFRRVRSAVRFASRSAPGSPPARRGFPAVRLPAVCPRLPGRAVSFLAMRLCSWRGFAPVVFRCLRRFLQSCFRPFYIRLARSPSPLRMRSLCGCRF